MVILNVQEAAKFLGKSPAALRNGYKRWRLPHFRLGGQIKFTQEALQEWVDKGMTTENENTVPSAKSATDRRTREYRRQAHA